MDSQPARLPQDLLRSLIVPGLAPTPVYNYLSQNHRTESEHHSHLAGSSHSEQKDGITKAPQPDTQDQFTRKHTMAEMDIDFDLAPLPQTPATNSQIPARPKANTPVAEPGKLYTLEEWDALFPIPKQPVKQPAQLPTPGKPVPLPPKSNNPEAIPRFNHLCQVHSLTSSFTFTEVEQGLFSSRLEFGNYVYEEPGPFTSKKLAKEAVAVRGLSTLENIESPP